MYDENLAARVRELVAGRDGYTEQKMFGGLGFMLNGHMALAANGKGGLMVRVDPKRSESLLDGDTVRLFEMGGRQMDGWLHVDTAAVEDDDELRRFVDYGVDYVSGLPPKAPKKAKPR